MKKYVGIAGLKDRCVRVSLLGSETIAFRKYRVRDLVAPHVQGNLWAGTDWTRRPLQEGCSGRIPFADDVRQPFCVQSVSRRLDLGENDFFKMWLEFFDFYMLSPEVAVEALLRIRRSVSGATSFIGAAVAARPINELQVFGRIIHAGKGNDTKFINIPDILPAEAYRRCCACNAPINKKFASRYRPHIPCKGTFDYFSPCLLESVGQAFGNLLYSKLGIFSLKPDYMLSTNPGAIDTILAGEPRIAFFHNNIYFKGSRNLLLSSEFVDVKVRTLLSRHDHLFKKVVKLYDLAYLKGNPK